MILGTVVFDRWAALAIVHNGQRARVENWARGAFFSSRFGDRAMATEESSWIAQMLSALKRHWPEYSMEAAGLGIFMVSACLFATLLEFPGSPIH